MRRSNSSKNPGESRRLTNPFTLLLDEPLRFTSRNVELAIWDQKTDLMWVDRNSCDRCSRDLGLPVGYLDAIIQTHEMEHRTWVGTKPMLEVSLFSNQMFNILMHFDSLVSKLGARSVKTSLYLNALAIRKLCQETNPLLEAEALFGLALREYPRKLLRNEYKLVDVSSVISRIKRAFFYESEAARRLFLRMEDAYLETGDTAAVTYAILLSLNHPKLVIDPMALLGPGNDAFSPASRANRFLESLANFSRDLREESKADVRKLLQKQRSESIDKGKLLTVVERLAGLRHEEPNWNRVPQHSAYYSFVSKELFYHRETKRDGSFQSWFPAIVFEQDGDRSKVDFNRTIKRKGWGRILGNFVSLSYLYSILKGIPPDGCPLRTLDGELCMTGCLHSKLLPLAQRMHSEFRSVSIPPEVRKNWRKSGHFSASQCNTIYDEGLYFRVVSDAPLHFRRLNKPQFTTARLRALRGGGWTGQSVFRDVAHRV